MTTDMSFIYEDLVSHVESIRNSTNEIQQILARRSQIGLNQLKSRSFIFLDPYGNRMIDKYFDHEIIVNINEKYKNDYVPKYLQSWIKFGTINDDRISSFNNFQLKSAVSNYPNDHQFITYGQITLWIGDFGHSLCHKFDLNVLLTDNLDKIKIRIGELGQMDDIQIKLCTIKENIVPNEDHWNKSIILKSEDTIMSCQLYKNDRIIMGKFGGKKPNDDCFYFSNSYLFVKTFTKTTFLWAYLAMTIEELKSAIEKVEGTPVYLQRLIYNNRQLEDGQNLAECNIPRGSTIHLVEKMRGGMYHFTSGRQDFWLTTYDGGKAVKNILQFKIKNPSRVRRYSSIQLQDYILQAQNLLSTLYRDTERIHFDENIPHLKEIILQ